MTFTRINLIILFVIIAGIRGNCAGVGDVTYRSRQANSCDTLRPWHVAYNDKYVDRICFLYRGTYDVYDNWGRIVLRGIDDSVDISSLVKGKYFINLSKEIITKDGLQEFEEKKTYHFWKVLKKP